MYKLHVIRPTQIEAENSELRSKDGSYNIVETHDYKQKPTFEDMYKQIGCDMIEMSKAYYPHYSNRKDGYVDIYFDEEFLMKETKPNIGATVAWKKWQDKTGHMALPGSVLHGTVCVIQKDLIPNLEEQSETT